MIENEKQTKKSIFKRFTACFLATFSALLFIFYLGYYCGSVYAEDLFPEVDDQYQISPDEFDWLHAEFFQNFLSNLNSQPVMPEDDFIFFNTESYQLSGANTYGYSMSFYFCLGEAIATQTESQIVWNSSDTYFRVFYQGGSRMNLNTFAINYQLQPSTFFKGTRLEYEIAEDRYTLYVLGNNGQSVPMSLPNYSNQDGSFSAVRNFETNIKEISQDINVITTITPNLSGTVDLNRIIDGTLYKGSSFKIRFENHSNFPVQVRWYARRTGLGRLSTDNLFQYGNLNIKNDCAAMIFQHGNVYTKNMNSQTWFDANLTMSQMKNSEWFSLGTNEYNNYKELEISYTSTSFQPNVSYTWYTEALRTGSYGSVCEVFYSGSTGENPYPTNHAVDIDGLTLCQSDTFQFTSQYTYSYQSSGVGSDASCVGSDEDYLINTYSSSGRSDTVGSEGGDSSYKNLYLDKTSWLHEYSNEKWTNSGGSQYTDVLLRDANGFTAFIKSAFNIFPPEVNAVIVFTFIAVGFVIILKFVRG